MGVMQLPALTAHQHGEGKCIHDAVLDEATHQEWTQRRLSLLDEQGKSVFPHLLSRQELRRELSNRGVKQDADSHKRRLKSARQLSSIQSAGWQPIRIAYVPVGWEEDALMTEEKQALLGEVMDEAVRILGNALAVRINDAPLRVSRACAAVFFANGKCAVYQEEMVSALLLCCCMCCCACAALVSSTSCIV
jgi:hypothetical protein